MQRCDQYSPQNPHIPRPCREGSSEDGGRWTVAVVDAVMLRDADLRKTEPIGPFRDLHRGAVKVLGPRTEGGRAHVEVQTELQSDGQRSTATERSIGFPRLPRLDFGLMSAVQTRSVKKRAENGASTGDRLLAGAADLFRRKGYAATTTRELSAHLGIQNASLYYHMEKKEDLLFKLCLATLEDVTAAFEACTVETNDPLERLDLMARRYTATALRDRDRHATMLIELRALSKDRRDRIVAVRDTNVGMVRRTVAAAQKAGQVRTDIHAKYLTLLLFNLLNWSIFWYHPDGALSAEEIADMICSVYLDGVVTDRARAKARRFSRSARRSASPKRAAPKRARARSVASTRK